jgi:hypothetical protein
MIKPEDCIATETLDATKLTGYFFKYAELLPLLSWVDFNYADENYPGDIVCCRMNEYITDFQDFDLSVQMLANRLSHSLESYLAHRLYQNIEEELPEVIDVHSEVIHFYPEEPYHYQTIYKGNLHYITRYPSLYITPGSSIVFIPPTKRISVNLTIGESIDGKAGLWARRQGNIVQGGFALSKINLDECRVTHFENLKAKLAN